MSSEEKVIQELQARFPKLMRPDQVKKLPNLDVKAKATYETGFQNCWHLMAQHSANSEGKEFQNALAKLQNATNKVISQYHQWRKDQAARPQDQQSTQSASQPSQPTQAATPAQSTPSQAQPSQPSQPIQSQPTQQPQPAQSQQQRPSISQAQPPQPNQQAPAGQAQQQNIPPDIIKNVNAFPFQVPLNMTEGSPEAQKHVQEAKNAYTQALVKSHRLLLQVKQLQQEIERRKMANQEIPLPISQQRQKAEQELAAHQKWISEFRGKQTQLKAVREQRQRQQGADTQVKAEPNQPNQINTGSAAGFNLQLPGPRNPTTQRTSTADTPLQNPSVEAARNSMSAGRSPMTPTTAGPSQQQSAQGQPPQSAGAAPQPQGQGQAPTAVRPQLNTQQQPNLSHIAQSPHSANPNGLPVALTHSAAMIAARSYSESQQQNRNAGTPQQATQLPQQIPANYHNREQQNKIPISKTFTATAPQPVNMAAGRPTLGGGTHAAPGIVGQPAITKNPHFTIEGEGERVLSRRKLQELVRQVAGGEGAQGEFMTAEVEEAICELADEFIDTVATHACRLAKTRESHTLEIRDIQTILERNYNIRIPGYAIDDVRTVRKFQPAAAWQAKMNAVQAAKVMGGKTE